MPFTFHFTRAYVARVFAALCTIVLSLYTANNFLSRRDSRAPRRLLPPRLAIRRIRGNARVMRQLLERPKLQDSRVTDALHLPVNTDYIIKSFDARDRGSFVVLARRDVRVFRARVANFGEYRGNLRRRG